jgi:hypothetical protein
MAAAGLKIRLPATFLRGAANFFDFFYRKGIRALFRVHLVWCRELKRDLLKY